MPRSKAGVKRGHIDRDNLKNAVLAVTCKDETVISIREASRIYGVSIATLSRHKKRFEENNEFSCLSDNLAHRRVFTDEEETELTKYIQTMARMHYGLTTKGVREFVFQFAQVNENENIPEAWLRDKCAGEEWLRQFQKRNPTLSVRKPEATSLARSTAFNKVSVGMFFSNLKDIHVRFGPIPPERVWNLDESGYTTVGVPPKVMAEKGTKQVGAIVTAERGQLVTLIAAISATGNSLPPYLIFPRVTFKDYMLNGAPSGSDGTATPSGWSNEHVFLKYLEFFIKHVKPSKDSPTLLILDNHESHRSIEAIDMAKDNGIIMLTFPPHCTHRMQPLDTHCFGSFRTAYNTALSNWHLSNPGKAFTIYHISSIVGTAFPRSFTPLNIIHGFRDTGIFPVDMNVYREEQFAPSIVTDQPDPAVQDAPPVIMDQPSPGIQDNGISVEQTTNQAEKELVSTASTTPCCSKDLPQITPAKRKHISPEEMRPYPKAERRVEGKKRRKTGKTTILTDTPEKEAIMLQKSKSKKKPPQPVRKRGRPKLNKSADPVTITTETTKKTIPIKKAIVKKVVMKDESSDDAEDVLANHLSESEGESSEGGNAISESDGESEGQPMTVGSYILTKVHGTKKDFELYYIAQILKSVPGGFEVKWFKRMGRSEKFVENTKEDDNFVPTVDVIEKMSPPTVPSGSRYQDTLQFPIKSQYHLSLQ